jgi:hypothetical protein
MQAYLLPAVFAETRSALEAQRGSPLAILSNGSPGMLDSAVRNNDLESCFAEVISVDSVKTYNPSPRVYPIGPKVAARRIILGCMGTALPSAFSDSKSGCINKLGFKGNISEVSLIY